jgi:hypothetical protein
VQVRSIVPAGAELPAREPAGGHESGG